jgi:hypothetical protein
MPRLHIFLMWNESDKYKQARKYNGSSLLVALNKQAAPKKITSHKI